jgi:hypothetical protein
MQAFCVSIGAEYGEHRFNPPWQTMVRAATATDARVVALRRFYGNRKICAFVPYNPLPGQDPSGQAGYGYQLAPRRSGASLACATHMLRVHMDPV